jgi:hypothetical protein
MLDPAMATAVATIIVARRTLRFSDPGTGTLTLADATSF